VKSSVKLANKFPRPPLQFIFSSPQFFTDSFPLCSSLRSSKVSPAISSNFSCESPSVKVCISSISFYFKSFFLLFFCYVFCFGVFFVMQIKSIVFFLHNSLLKSIVFFFLNLLDIFYCCVGIIIIS